MRRLAYVAVTLLAVFVILGFIAKGYLRSKAVTDQVRAKLQEAIGGPVEVGQADIGFGSSSISGVQIRETEQSKEEPWITVGALTTDLNVFSVLRGATPNEVTIRGAKVLLRFDREGKLLTKLPEPPKQDNAAPMSMSSLPEITLKESQITFRKEGAEDLVAEDVNLTLTRSAQGPVASGGFKAKEWGTWTAKGNADESAKSVTIVLVSGNRVKVNEALLNQIPFVPARVWRSTKIPTGETNCTLTLAVDLQKADLHYKAELEPTRATVEIPAIDFTAQNAHGKVTIADNLVTLRDVEGDAYDGKVRADADLDFRGPGVTFKFFRVVADKLVMEDLPASWMLPRTIQGKIVGTAALEIEFPPEGKMKTSGEGKARVLDAKIAGQPAEITLQLKPAPGGFRFSSGGDGAWNRGQGRAVASKFRYGLEALQRASLGQPKEKTLEQKAGSFTNEALNQIFRGRINLRGLTEAIDPALLPPRPKAGDPPNYLDLNLKLKDIDLAPFVKELGMPLPASVSAKLSFQAKASIPLDNANDLRLYKVKGAAQLTQIHFGDLVIDELATDIDYSGGMLRLPNLQGKMGPAGAIRGNAVAQVAPMGPVRFTVAVSEIPLGEVMRIAAKDFPAEGNLSGTLSATGDLNKAADITAWTAAATLASPRLAILGTDINAPQADLSLSKGQASITGFKATVEGAPISMSADLALADPYAFQAKVAIPQADLAMLNRLAPDFRLPVAIVGKVGMEAAAKGALQPLAFVADGTVNATNLKVENVLVEKTNFRFAATEKALEIRDLQLDLYKGHVNGSATIPLKDEVAGKVNLGLKSVDAAALIKSIPAIPLKVRGEIDGSVQGDLPPVKAGKSREFAAQVELQAPKLTVQNVPAEKLVGSVNYKPGAVDYKLEGKTLGGSFELEGSVPLQKKQAIEKKEGRLEIRDVQLARLLQSFGANERVGNLRGRISVDVKYQQEEFNEIPTGSGRIRFSDVAWADSGAPIDVVGDLVLEDDVLRLREMTATIGEGVLRASVRVDLKHPERSFFVVKLENAEASKILRPWLDDKIKGPLQGRVRGSLGAEWSGTIDAELVRGEVYGIGVTQWRVPAQWRYSPVTQLGQITIAETTAHMASGRATGKLTANFGFGARIDAQVQLVRADMKSLLGGSSTVGGYLTGKFVVKGDNVRSVEDLDGAFDAVFSQTQAAAVPILSDIAPILGIGSSTTFQKGDFKARMDRGVIRIQRLAMEGGIFKVFIDGTADVKGRLNLNVVANAGNLLTNVPGLRILTLRFPVAGNASLSLLQEANLFLANRVIYAQVTGTVRNPNTRILPLPTLQQEAIRFFLFSSGIPIAP